MEKAIKKYLDNRAKIDELFAAKYANPKKSIDECCKYITGEAYARAKNGCAVISDEEVYGMAVHYYDEEDINIRKAPNARTAKINAEPELTKEQQEALRLQAEKEYKAQISAEFKQKEIERKAKAREKKPQPQMASLFD
ncbi:MAG: PcfK-like family protein [Bacteroidaceae bacterium]|nr:PcfK-like family protein [Bacteroidaceae bacterium]